MGCGWYNAPLFDSETGRATPALYELKNFADETTGISNIHLANETNKDWYTIEGKKIEKPTQKGIYIHNHRKIVVGR